MGECRRERLSSTNSNKGARNNAKSRQGRKNTRNPAGGNTGKIGRGSKPIATSTKSSKPCVARPRSARKRCAACALARGRPATARPGQNSPGKTSRDFSGALPAAASSIKIKTMGEELLTVNSAEGGVGHEKSTHLCEIPRARRGIKEQFNIPQRA